MVSNRCKMIVKAELERYGLYYRSVQLGEAEITENISSVKWGELNAALKKSGIELLEGKKNILIEKIKTVIIEQVHYSEGPLGINFSVFLSQKLNHDYTYLANVFSESQGITIEHFHMAHKIERVKELLVYDELNITEIAWKLGYSSIAHLSNQFKKMTGLKPSDFKKLKNKIRTNLEDL
jgi:YesN/AraC family two-component response regulator